MSQTPKEVSLFSAAVLIHMLISCHFVKVEGWGELMWSLASKLGLGAQEGSLGGNHDSSEEQNGTGRQAPVLVERRNSGQQITLYKPLGLSYSADF